MASPTHPHTKRRSPPPPPPSPSISRPKPSTGGGFFFKFVLFALFLLALPLFPSQAPDFVAETVFTKFWELIHLLFVGIAVAYGLFSRRNVESGVSSTSRVVDESSLSYVSRIFPVSSVFDEEFDNSCDFVDMSSSTTRAGSGNVVVKERKSESFVVESGLREEEEEVNEVRAWNSQYFQGRSKVVVARPAYGLEGHVVHQPLGLPVRSLRSSLRDNVAPEDSVFSDNGDGAVNGNDESLVGEGFEEVIAAPPSPVVPWDMMGMGEDYHSNFQPLPVDETHFTTLKSTSSRSSGSSSSQASFVSQSQNRFSTSRSVSEESNVEESVKEKSLEDSSRASSPSLPPSPPLSPAPPLPEVVIDETNRRVSHSRHYSDGSLVEDNVRQGFEDELEGSNVRGRRKKELGSKSLNSVNAESSRRRNKSRRSYPPESISSPVGGTEDSTTRRRHLHQKSDDQLFEDSLGKRVESEFDSHRIKKGRSQDSLEPRAEDSTTRRRHLHQKSDDQLLEESLGEGVESEFNNHRIKKGRSQDSLKLTAEESPTRRRHLHQKSDDQLLGESLGKGMESDFNNHRIKKGRSQDSLELTAEDSTKDKKFSESFPPLDVLFQPTNAKASRRAMRSSRGDRDTFPEKDITRRNSEDDSKSRKKDIPGYNKELKSNSLGSESQSWRASSNVPSRGKSVRTIRSDRHGKERKKEEYSSEDRAETKLETRGRTKSRRQQQEDLAIVLHEEKTPEPPHTMSEPEDDVIEQTEVEQPQVTTLEEEEEEAAWESQSNASHDHNEVDRKAGEFIAKFREQIRLQKLTSGEQPRGGGGGGTSSIMRDRHFR